MTSTILRKLLSVAYVLSIDQMVFEVVAHYRIGEMLADYVQQQPEFSQ